MFTNKEKRSIVWGGKGKDRVVLTKSLINARVGRGTLRGVLLGAIQIIRDTFSAYFRPPSPMCLLVTQAWTPGPPPAPVVT